MVENENELFHLSFCALFAYSYRCKRRQTLKVEKKLVLISICRTRFSAHFA